MAKWSSAYYVKLAKRSGMQVTQGAKHIKISTLSPDGIKSTMMIPRDLKGNGTERAIIKWFLKMGIVIALILALILGLL